MSIYKTLSSKGVTRRGFIKGAGAIAGGAAAALTVPASVRSAFAQGDDVIRVDAVYNQSLGYPERILVRMRAEPNWFHMDMWKHLWSKRTLPSCNFLAEGSKIIRILSITPVR